MYYGLPCLFLTSPHAGGAVWVAVFGRIERVGKGGGGGWGGGSVRGGGEAGGRGGRKNGK